MMAGLFGRFYRNNDQPTNKPFKCFILLTGKTLNSHNDLMDRLKRKVPDLQVVQTEAECDIILVFCPVIIGPEHDIKSALETLNNISDTKSAVLVVLHHTFDAEYVAPDYSRAVSRGNTLTVSCLFHEDRGLLQCQTNEESVGRIVTHITPQIQRIKYGGNRMETGRYCAPTGSHSVIPKSVKERVEIGHWLSSFDSANKQEKNNTEQIKRNDQEQAVYTGSRSLNQQEKNNNEKMNKKHPGQAGNTTLKYFILLTGRTLNTDEIFMSRLKREIPQLQQVSTVDQCDVIVTFCPVVSRAMTDIEAAVRKLNQESADKPAVLVVLHRTLNPEHVVPDSSRSVRRENTVTVDCLFCEDEGLLQCRKNQESLTRIINYIKPQIQSVQSKVKNVEIHKTPLLAEHDYKLNQINKKDVLLFTSANHIQAKPDVEHCEPMDAQEEGGASQCRDKLQNIKSETTLEIQLQEKERQLEEMRTELKKLKTELAEKNEELKKKESLLPLSEGHLMREHVQDKGKDRHLREMTQDEKKLKEVKAELDNTIQNLEQKKKELRIVSKHLSEGIKVCEINKSQLDSMQKKLQEKNKQIQEIIS